MNHDLEVAASIEVNVTPERMWDVLTNPELIAKYLFGTKTITDWKVGSDIIFQGEYNGQTYKDKGIVRESTPHNKLSYRYWSAFSGTEDKPENYTLVTYTIAPLPNGHVKFTWSQKGYADEQGYEHSKAGMPEFLQQIKGIAEM